MAQRFISALDYADTNARRILRKHAKKRPLGDIETKHRYTPAQPVLSCRTVDIDVTGTRTYRPKSTTDIIQEQHRLIHDLYTKRNITSAPPRRKTAQSNKLPDNSRKFQRINKFHDTIVSKVPPSAKNKTVEVQGRPLTSQSQSAINVQPRKKSAIRRPKTTGRIRSAASSYATVPRDDKELLETSRSTKELTSKIHEHWEPENHNLNQGKFVRGQSKADEPPSLDTWLTFGGAPIDETSGGIIDAFAQFRSKNEFYSVEGGVGSRIAQQLQKGDKIRIGINGRMQSHDLRVRQWKKSNKEDIIEEKAEEEKMEKVVIPLCWQDQVSNPKARVISPRSQNNNIPQPNLCETHPVIFTHREEDKSRPRLASADCEGYRVKQRPKSRPGLDGQDHDNKIVVLTIDQHSREEEDKIQALTVDDVLRHSVITKNVNVKRENEEKDETGDNEDGNSNISLNAEIVSENAELLRSASKVSMAESHVSGGSDTARTPKFKPITPSFTVQNHSTSDLAVGPSSGTLARTPPEGGRSASSSRIGSEKSTSSLRMTNERGSAKHIYKPANKPGRVTSPAAFAVYGTKGETEFIQISTQIRNPNPPSGPQMTINKPQELYITQSVSDEAIRQVSKQNMMEMSEAPRVTPAPASTPEPPDTATSRASDRRSVTPTASLAINIPTAEDFSERDSAANSPWPTNRVEAYDSVSQRKKDSQIEQITTLMEGTVVERETSRVSEKSVTFNLDD